MRLEEIVFYIGTSTSEAPRKMTITSAEDAPEAPNKMIITEIN